ncbi:MAG: hypothetical protein JW829_11550 [Pirellulales bacterium]|nr:hypothetical protein [Pirellulales bacterium]
MNPREKIMAAIVVALLAVFGLRLIHNRIEDRVTQKSEELEGIQSRLDAALDDLEIADRANTKLQEWRSRSLPRNEDVARSRYQQWVGDQLKQAGMANINISNTLSAFSVRSAYGTLTVSVNADGSLDSLIQFLFTFYRTDFLHKIRSLNVSPTSANNLVKLTITIEALILPDADLVDQLPERTSDRLLQDDMQAYQKSIGERNLFITYQAPPPPKPPVVHHDPPPSPPKPVFDDATQAYITGIVEREGQLEAWINVRTTGESLRLNKGESFDIGLMSGHVVDITLRAVLLETKDGLVQVGFGQSLREGKLLDTGKGS